MDEWQVMINFMKDSVHLREIGAAVAICGAPVAGYFFKRFMYIGQLGGRRGCQDCVKEAGQRMMEKQGE